MNISARRAWWPVVALALAGAASVNACSAADGAKGVGGSGASDTTTSGVGQSSGQGGTVFTTTSTSVTTGPIDEDASCASVSSEATSELKPADIVIAVDTSGSMDEESAQVQANLNNFATIIKNSGIDVHVVLIADSSVCIPGPLGSGACNGADEKLPEYRHVLQPVDSTNGLAVILDSYPQWQASLRPNATKTIAIVSDDDSASSAANFINALLAKDPTFQGFKFDAIVAFDPPSVCTSCILDCSPCIAQSACCFTGLFVCDSYAAKEGAVYKQLVQQTGGVIGNLCIQDFGPVFQDMATSVVQNSQLSCEYVIPTVPGGGMIDPNKVNVNYTPGSTMMPQPILYVPTGASGCGMNGGWYYDNPTNPTKIIMCPTTCMMLQGDPNGRVDVLFGCDTVVKPPE